MKVDTFCGISTKNTTHTNIHTTTQQRVNKTTII